MELELKNYMEVLVNQKIDSVLEGMNICKCEKCIYDIKAIALNSLPCKYVVSYQGEVFAKLMAFQQQNDTNIIIALTRAAKIVSENPKH